MDLYLKTVGKIHSTKVSCVREEILFFYVAREKNHIFEHTISAWFNPSAMNASLY